jgi:hypothetical protein
VGYDELPGDVLVGPAQGDEVQHLQLVLTQWLDQVTARGWGVAQPAQPGEAFRAGWARRRSPELIELFERVDRADLCVAQGNLAALAALGYAELREAPGCGEGYVILRPLIERDRRLSRMTPETYARWKARAENAAR